MQSAGWVEKSVKKSISQFISASRQRRMSRVICTNRLFWSSKLRGCSTSSRQSVTTIYKCPCACARNGRVSRVEHRVHVCGVWRSDAAAYRRRLGVHKPVVRLRNSRRTILLRFVSRRKFLYCCLFL